MNTLTGDSAQVMIKLVLRDLGFLAECPVSYEEVFQEITSNINSHFTGALAGIIEKEGSLNVGVNTLVDYALACDGFIEDREGNIVSYDVTTDNSVYTINHKYNVQDKIKFSKKRLGLGQHIIVILRSNKPYTALSLDDKYLVLDTLLDAIENKDSEVYISI